MSDVSMIIGGERRAASATFGVVNPATGEVHAEAPDCTREQLDEAFAAAAKAFDGWRKDEDARREALRNAAKALTAAADRIGPVLTAEQGKPLASAKIEAYGAGYWMKYYSRLELPRDVIQDDEQAYAEVIRRPIGVVAAITPWNFPIMLAAWKIAPALLAGNTIVLKPSPFTPRSSLVMGEVLSEVLPPGVLNVVTGGDELGQWMTSHPTPRKISFTGSVATGKHVAAAAAPDLKRVTLELGGNDPAILLDDVDVAAITDKLFAVRSTTRARSARRSSGCTCPNRSTTRWPKRSPRAPPRRRSATAWMPTPSSARSRTVRSSSASAASWRTPWPTAPPRSPVVGRSTDPGTSSSRRS